MSKPFGWIAVDLDGTLAHYDGWRGIEHIGAPIALMVDRVKAWLAAGEDVRIFTARVDGGQVAIDAGDTNGEAHRDVAAVKHHIEQWCIEHIGQCLPVTNIKDYGMRQLWDDRAVSVEPNTGRVICVECVWQPTHQRRFDGHQVELIRKFNGHDAVYYYVAHKSGYLETFREQRFSAIFEAIQAQP